METRGRKFTDGKNECHEQISEGAFRQAGERFNTEGNCGEPSKWSRTGNFTERDKAVTDIFERMSESEMAAGTQKQLNDEAAAKEMKRKATERFGETIGSHCEDYDSVGDDDEDDDDVHGDS